MLRDVIAVVFFVLFCQTLQAQNNNLQLKLLNGGKKEVDAGVNINVLIMFTNNADSAKEFDIRLNTTGDNWKTIADYSSIQIEKNSKLTKIVGIQIPNNLKAGDFTIELEAFENPGHTSFGKVFVPLNVRPRYKIAIEKLNTKQHLFAGDTLGVRFLVQNLSNIDVEVKTTCINDQESKVSHLHIPKDSSILTNVTVSIAKDITSYTQQSVILTAVIADRPETEQSVYHSFDIFPSKNIKFDKFNRYPIRVSSIFVSSNRWGKIKYSTMYDIFGGGFINNEKRQRLDIHLRGPDRSGNPLFGLNDEYYLKYSSPKTEISLGDNNFSLSDLTESSRNGRGVKFQYNLKNLSVGSYYAIPRYFPLIKYVYSFYSSYKFNQDNILSAGYLSKTDTTNQIVQLLTLSGENSPFSWLKTDFEVALGQKLNQWAKAFRGSILLRYSILNSHLSYTQADPDYPGFVSNTTRLLTGISVNLKKVNFYLNYDINNSNLALDTLYSNAPISTNLNLSAGYRLNPKHVITLGVYSTSQKDKNPIPLFDYNKYNGRIALQDKFGTLSTNFQWELGKIESLLGTHDGDLTTFYNGTLSVNYDLNKTISTSGSVSYQGGKQYKIIGYDRFYYGGSLVADLKEKLSVSLHYNSNFELKDYNSDRSLLSLQLNSKFHPQHEVSLSVNYNLVKNTLNTKEFSLQARYTYTLNVPISKRKDVGSLTGKIINHGLENVGGMRLNLNGIITITDKDGNFKFPVVKVGTYLLVTDESSIGLNTIPETPGPYWVTIKSAKETRFELAVTKSARVHGRLVIQEDEQTGKKGFYPIKEQVEKLIIEASNGTEIFRILSGNDGSFSFEDLRPGNWHIKVYPSGIPQGYQLITDQFNCDLAPGKNESLDVIIKKKARQIKFQSKF